MYLYDFPSIKYEYSAQEVSKVSLILMLFYSDLILSRQQRNVFFLQVLCWDGLRLDQSAAPNECVTSSELRTIRLFICIDQFLVTN
jgi:hypothetical protein